MPFTLAHPAVILPLSRVYPRWLLPLIAGTLAPDLLYFFPERWARHFPNSHTASGVFTVAPLAAFALLVLGRAGRRYFVGLLSGRHRVLIARSLEGFGGRAADWLLAVPCVAVGIVLHLGWDSFTHSYGWPVQHSDLLRTLVTLGPLQGELFRWLQWVSSVIGLVALGVAYARAVRSIPAGEAAEFPAGGRPAVLLAFAVIAVLAGISRVMLAGGSTESIHSRTYLASTTGVGVFVVLFVIGGMVAEVARRRAQTAVADGS